MISPNEMLAVYSKEVKQALGEVNPVAIGSMYQFIWATMMKGEPIYTMGNGGSAAIAEHMSCDHGKGVTHDTDIRAQVVSLPSNMSLTTAIANDLGYDQIFSFQMKQAKPSHGLLVGISSSGNSPNILKALVVAAERDIPTIALVGFDGGAVLRYALADVIVHVPVSNYGMVEDCHQMIMHVMSQTIRSNYHKGETVPVL